MNICKPLTQHISLKLALPRELTVLGPHHLFTWRWDLLPHVTRCYINMMLLYLNVLWRPPQITRCSRGILPLMQKHQASCWCNVALEHHPVPAAMEWCYGIIELDNNHTATSQSCELLTSGETKIWYVCVVSNYRIWQYWILNTYLRILRIFTVQAWKQSTS